MESKLPVIVLVAMFAILINVSTAVASRIDLLFDIELIDIYSWGETTPPGANIGDLSTMRISFNTDIRSMNESVDPWGPGTSRLYTYFDSPTLIDYPFTQYLPGNPMQHPVSTTFSAVGVTSNGRISVGGGTVWHEDLWFKNQYYQYSQSAEDGIDLYRYRFNVHWEMQRFDFTPDKLYYFDEAAVINVLNRSINDSVTFNLREMSSIKYIDGRLFGYDIEGTATLRDFNIASTVPEPTTMLLLGIGFVGLSGVNRKKMKK